MPKTPPKVTKPDLTPRTHHGYAVVLFVLGSLLPPLAVAARFGFGGDFWLNLFLTICGYIPGHLHNFYIQNIRNNKNHRRTPKWAQRYGLVDTSEIKRKERKSQWAHRYNDRLPRSTLEGQPLEEGQEATSSLEISSDGHGARRRPEGGDGLWRAEDEEYYNPDNSPPQQTSHRWHYPANFNNTSPGSPVAKKSKKKDRWARTEDAYNMPEEQSRRKSKKRSKREPLPPSLSRDSSNNFPEAAEGGLYGDKRNEGLGNQHQVGGDDEFNHQF